MVNVPLKAREAAEPEVIVPLTVTFCVLAPVLATVTLRALRVLVTAEAFMRTKMVVLGTALLLLIKRVSAFVVKFASLLVSATAKPEGGVTVMLFDKFAPSALKDCAEEGTFTVELKDNEFVGLTVMLGGRLVTTPLRGTLLVAPPPESARLPSRLFVAGALVEVRTATTPPVEASVKELEPGVAKEFAEIS